MMAILASLGSGLLLFLSFPKFNLWPLAWVALVPLLHALQDASSKRAFLYGWVTGIVYFLGCLYWVTHTMVQYGNLPVGLSFLFMLLLVTYLGAYVGLFAYLYSRTMRSLSPLTQVLTVPALWVTLEWFRAHLLTGFPWALLGYSQYQVLGLIQISDLTGVYGVSFFLVTLNVVLAQILKIGIRSGAKASIAPLIWKPLLAGAALVFLVVIYGGLRIAQFSAKPITSSLRVGLIQGNISQEQKWDPSFQRRTLEIYERLTQEAFLSAAPQLSKQGMIPSASGQDQTQTPRTRPDASGLDLVVWPETAAPFFYEQDRLYQNELKTFAHQQRVALLFGSPALGPPPGQSASGKSTLFNSAYLVSSEGLTVSRYDKIHLVPFGEYVPFSSLLFFVHKLVEGIGDFAAGRDFTVMQIPAGRFGVVICFEVIFPELVRQFVKEGAHFMATLTNDAWFGHSSAPYQHFSMVVFRAIENRVPVIRAANTGITGTIDATGRIGAMTELFTEAYVLEEIILKDIRTFYTEYGDLFAYLCGIMSLSLLARGFWKG
jgi:apolipoprotein N-acyltransferase